MTWASELPYDACGPVAFRVLLKLADVAAKDGTRAWRAVQGDYGMADELHVSPRTIQRALRELEQAGLIRQGDQRYVGHLRADRRPTVYDLAMPEAPPMDSDLATNVYGVTSRGDISPVDNSHGVTTGVARTTTYLDRDKNVTKRNARAREQQPLEPEQVCAADSAPGIARPHRWSRLGFCANGCGATQ